MLVRREVVRDDHGDSRSLDMVMLGVMIEGRGEDRTWSSVLSGCF